MLSIFFPLEFKYWGDFELKFASIKVLYRGQMLSGSINYRNLDLIIFWLKNYLIATDSFHQPFKKGQAGTPAPSNKAANIF